jgi:prepilin-type N-terminal cleavage/methylation domain-containing protein
VIRLAERLQRESGEEGFTLIEVLIAAFILALGSFAIFMAFAMAVKNVERGRDTQIALSVAQREMEKIRSLPYERVVMTAAPASTTETASPANRVSGAEYSLTKAGTEKKPLAIAAAGVCTSAKPCVNNTPASTCVGASTATFTNGSATGSVYCYVTTVKDEACELATKKTCTYKRVVVAAWLAKPNSRASRPAYYETQANFFETG